MALSDVQIEALVGNQTLQQQMETALVAQSLNRVGVATGAELLLAQAIIKNPTAYTTRFLTDALILNAAALTSTNGSTLDVPPTDAAIAAAVTTMWAAQFAAGV